jgi:hypothetical protein
VIEKPPSALLFAWILNIRHIVIMTSSLLIGKGNVMETPPSALLFAWILNIRHKRQIDMMLGTEDGNRRCHRDQANTIAGRHNGGIETYGVVGERHALAQLHDIVAKLQLITDVAT